MGIVRVTPRAESDLADIWGYIAADSDAFADAMLDRIAAKLAALAEQPQLGRARPELLETLRSFVIGNYVLFYQPLPDGILLIRVLHGARDVRTALGV
jgi:toxin ParE1/3/4